MRKIFKMIPVLVAALFAVALVGCGDSLPVLGTKGDGMSDVAITNGLGVTVTQVQLKASGSDTWSDGLLTDDQSLEAEKEARLYYPSDYATGEVDVQVTAQDGTVLTFEGLSLGSFTKLTLMSGDGVNYVDYTGSDGNTGSTKQAALDAKTAAEEAAKKAAEEEAAKKAAEEEAAKKAAEEEAAKKAAEEEAAKQAAAAAAAASSSSSSSSGSSQSYSGGSSSGSGSSSSGSSSSGSSSSSSDNSASAATPSQSEDQCVDNPVFRE